MNILDKIADRARFEAREIIGKDRKYLQDNWDLIVYICPYRKLLTTYIHRGYSLSAEIRGYLLCEYIKEHSLEIGNHYGETSSSSRKSHRFKEIEPFNTQKFNIMNYKNALAKLAEKIKEQALEKILPERKLMEELKNDETITTKEEKDSILDYYVNHGWSLEGAIENRLKNKYYEEEKLKLMKEFFPDFKIEDDEKD